MQYVASKDVGLEIHTPRGDLTEGYKGDEEERKRIKCTTLKELEPEIDSMGGKQLCPLQREILSH